MSNNNRGQRVAIVIAALSRQEALCDVDPLTQRVLFRLFFLSRGVLGNEKLQAFVDDVQKHHDAWANYRVAQEAASCGLFHLCAPLWKDASGRVRD